MGKKYEYPFTYEEFKQKFLTEIKDELKLIKVYKKSAIKADNLAEAIELKQDIAVYEWLPELWNELECNLIREKDKKNG